MKTTSRRGFLVLILVAVVSAGLVILGGRFAVNGEKWATLRANEHLTENGSFIGAGKVADRNGEVLAYTKGQSRKYNNSKRIRRATLHIVGDTEGYISSGVQTAYKTKLTGYNPVTGIYSLTKYGKGNDVKLTIDSKICATAYDALKGRKGVVAAYNYETGEILCSVSAPNYDINKKPSEKEINKNENGKYEGIYLNRLIDGLYTPGSVFKIVTTTSVVENNLDMTNWEYKCTGETIVDGVKVTCPKKHGTMNFEESFANSCNGAYAQLTLMLGKDKLQDTAKEMGFGKKFDFGNTKTVASRFDLSNATNADAAWAGVGQYETLVNPYHMLTILGAVANDGKAVLPYVVSNVTNPAGKVVEKAGAKTETYLSPEVSQTVKGMMQNNIKTKYGSWQFEGLSMGGKTGTAEVEKDKEPHSWFMGFSGNPKCPVAIVVVVENGGWGSSTALPIASKVMKEIYKSMA